MCSIVILVFCGGYLMSTTLWKVGIFCYKLTASFSRISEPSTVISLQTSVFPWCLCEPESTFDTPGSTHIAGWKIHHLKWCWKIGIFYGKLFLFRVSGVRWISVSSKHFRWDNCMAGRVSAHHEEDDARWNCSEFFLEKFAQGTGQQRGAKMKWSWESGRPFPDRIGLRVLRHTDKAHAPTTPVLHSKNKPSYDRFRNMCFDIDIRVEVTSLTSELVPTEIVGASEHNTHEDFAWAEGSPNCTFVYHSKFRPCPGHAFARGGNVLQRAQQKLKKDFSTPNAICTRPFRRQWPTPRWNSMRHLRHFAFQMNIFHARWIRRLWGA